MSFYLRVITTAGGRRIVVAAAAGGRRGSTGPCCRTGSSFRPVDLAAAAFIIATDRQQTPGFAIMHNNFCAFLFFFFETV